MSEKYKTKIFFISPIGNEGSPERAHADLILRDVLCPLSGNVGMQFIRADEIAETPEEIDKIYALIRYAPILIADLSGLNPNVLHEIGIALAWGKAPILIAPDNISDGEIPFDLRQLSRIPYASTITERTATHHKNNLKDRLKTRIELAKDDIESLRYSRVTRFLEDTDRLSTKVDTIGNDVKEILARGERFNAVFIEGEEAAFNALTDAIKRAKIMVKTTRFSPFTVVEKYPNFFAAIQSATGRLEKGFQRIIAVNNGDKLAEVNQLVASNPGKKLTICLTQKEYNFEIVVIDNKEAFIHFRRADQPDIMIASTLHVKEEKVAEEFSVIFDHLLQPGDNGNFIVICEKLSNLDVAGKISEIKEIFDEASKHFPDNKKEKR
jgi:hypothetical protein